MTAMPRYVRDEHPPHKQGFVREDGMVFVQSRIYVKNGKRHETWVTRGTYEKRAQAANARTRNNKDKIRTYRQSLTHVIKNHKRGDVREDGKIFWGLSKTMVGGEIWLDQEAFTQKQERQTELARDHQRKRRKNPVHRTVGKLRARIQAAFVSKEGSKSRDLDWFLGCTFDEFLGHLEGLFRDGMSWANRGEWEFDHVVRCSTARNEAEVISLFHYTNTRPLWKRDNKYWR